MSIACYGFVYILYLTGVLLKSLVQYKFALSLGSPVPLISGSLTKHHQTLGRFHLQQIFVLVMSKIPNSRDINPNPCTYKWISNDILYVLPQLLPGCPQLAVSQKLDRDLCLKTSENLGYPHSNHLGHLHYSSGSVDQQELPSAKLT